MILIAQEYAAVKEQPAANNDKFVELASFLAKVTHFYKDDL